MDALTKQLSPRARSQVLQIASSLLAPPDTASLLPKFLQGNYSPEAHKFIVRAVNAIDDLVKKSKGGKYYKGPVVDPVVLEAVGAAFREKSTEINAVVKGIAARKLSSSEELVILTSPDIIGILFSSEALKEWRTSPKLVNAVIEPIFRWKNFSLVKDVICVGHPKLQFSQVSGVMLEAANSITPDRNDSTRSQLLAGKIASIFAVHSRPEELMLQAANFSVYQDTSNNFDPSPTITGVALDFYRTRQLILGLKAAVEELERRFPEGPIRADDLGCGALGLLGMTILAFSKRTVVNFVENNPFSKVLLESIIERFGLKHRARVILGDANNWEPEEKSHLIASETIGVHLSDEPFPLLIQNARRHLIEGGILVPERITITLAAVDDKSHETKAKFHSFIEPTNGRVNQIPNDSYNVDTVVFDSYDFEGQQLRFRVPYSLMPIDNCEYHLYVKHKIKVYGDYSIGECQSAITTCGPLISGNIRKGDVTAQTIYMTAARRERSNATIVSYNIGMPDLEVSIKDSLGK